MTADRVYLSHDDVERLTARLARQILGSHHEYDVLLGIARGGMSVTCLLAQVLDHGMIMTCHLRRYASDNHELADEPIIIDFPQPLKLSRKRVLVIDEVWDKGWSIRKVMDEVNDCNPRLVHSAVLHFKPEQNVFQDRAPDFRVEETNQWIVYPWEAFGQTFDKLPV